MEEKQFKYAKWMSDLPACPPPDCREVEMTGWRFVQHDVEYPNNFQPVYVINPGRFPRKIPCKALGLSFYSSSEEAKKAWIEQVESHPNFSVVVGMHVAQLKISQKDGVASLPDESNFGHFTFHEYIWADFAKKVVSTEPIVIL
jgi:hypothetical protein